MLRILFRRIEESKVLLNSGKIDLDSEALNQLQVSAIIKFESDNESDSDFANFIVERESYYSVKASFTKFENSSKKMITEFKANGLSVDSDKPLYLQFSTNVGSFEIQCSKIPFRERRE